MLGKAGEGKDLNIGFLIMQHIKQITQNLRNKTKRITETEGNKYTGANKLHKVMRKQEKLQRTTKHGTRQEITKVL